MITDKCYVCGSSNLRADRALSGRLVCTSCGNPYGTRKSGRNNFSSLNCFALNKKYWIFLVIFILAFIIVII